MEDSKRSYLEFASSSNPTLTILTADEERIPAHKEVLRLMCSSLDNSPPSDTWDLRSLSINGSPVTSNTVIAVLSVIYSFMSVRGYEQDHDTDHGIEDLCKMLLLADALGCSKTFFSRMGDLLGTVVEPKAVIAVPWDIAYPNWLQQHGDEYEIPEKMLTAASVAHLDLDRCYIIRPVSNSTDMHMTSEAIGKYKQQGPVDLLEFQYWQQQLTSQLELLLYVAFKLELPKLRDCVTRFLSSNGRDNSILPRRLLHPSMSAANRPSSTVSAEEQPQQSGSTNTPVLSTRVLQTAISSSLGLGMLTTACLQQPLGLEFGSSTMFRDIEDMEESMKAFSATLQRDLFIFKAGSRIEVRFDDGSCRITDKQSQQYYNTSYGVVLGDKSTF